MRNFLVLLLCYFDIEHHVLSHEKEAFTSGVENCRTSIHDHFSYLKLSLLLRFPKSGALKPATTSNTAETWQLNLICYKFDCLTYAPTNLLISYISTYTNWMKLRPGNPTAAIT